MLAALLDFFFPRMCPICGNRLELDERPLCLRCNIDMPRTMFWEHPYDNPLARMYWGKIPVEKVAAYFYFTSQSGQARMVYGAKYHGFANIAIEVGEMLADEMKGFFDDIDCIVPMPISISRRMARGYNQSEMLAIVISDITHKPIITNALQRKDFHQSQTTLNRWQRQENVADTFQLTDDSQLQGKHVLLIDDICTTGATLIACSNALRAIEGIRISVLTLGFTKE